MIAEASATEQVLVAHDVSEQEAPAREPKIRKRLRPPREISGHDEASLSWFFGQGLSIYEKSTFGPIVEKIVMDGYGSAPCGKCEGAGIIEEGGGVTLETRCRSCNGTGDAPRKAGEAHQWCWTCGGQGVEAPYEVELPSGGWCPSCRGTGCSPVERRAMRRPRCQWCRPDVVTVKDERAGTSSRLEIAAARVPRHCCPNCLGTGEEPLTAKRVQKDDEGGGVVANDAALTRFAITSRRADKVKDISPALHAALEAFYGDVGHRWARTEFGRMFALYHLTPAGKKLARVAAPTGQRKAGKKKNKAKSKAARVEQALSAVELNAQERIGVQANLQKTQHNDDRRALLKAAGEQAEALYLRAARAWNSVTSSKLERDAATRLEDNLKRLGYTNTAKLVRATARGAR